MNYPKQPPVEIKILEAILGSIWRLISWPFRKGKRGVGESGEVRIDKEYLSRKWGEIEELRDLGRPSNFRQAIIEADKLLAFCLSEMGYKGSLGEMLKATKDRFSPSVYNDLWQAHKIRNQLVHQVGLKILNWEAKEAIEKFKRGFKDLGVL